MTEAKRNQIETIVSENNLPPLPDGNVEEARFVPSTDSWYFRIAGQWWWTDGKQPWSLALSRFRDHR